MGKCSVPGCVNFGGFRFPKLDPEAFLIWKQRIQNPDMGNMPNEHVNKKYRVCKDHFSNFCFGIHNRRLIPRSLPTLNLPGFEGDATLYENSILPSDSSLGICPGNSCEDNILLGTRSDSNLRSLKNTTDLVPGIPDTNVETNNVFMITEDYIESIIKVDPDEIALHPEVGPEKPETDTHEELLSRYALLHRNHNDYRIKTEREMSLILGLFDNKSNGIYCCPKCEYICKTVNDLKIHLIAHAENKVCNICFKVFNTNAKANNHVIVHRKVS